MATTTMGVRLTDEERSWITEYAAFAGKSVSEVIRESVLETIEDAIDLHDYNEALSLEDNGEYYTTEEVMRMAMEAD